MTDRVEDFEPITAEHAELVAGTDATKECGVCGGTTVRIGDARYFRWRGELRISEVWTCEDCRTSGNRLLCRKTGRVVRLSHVHTGSGFETPDAGGELVADGGVHQDDGGIDRRDPADDPHACSKCGVHIGAFGNEYCDSCAREIGAKPPLRRCEHCGQRDSEEQMSAVDISTDDEYYPEFIYLCRSCSGGDGGGD